MTRPDNPSPESVTLGLNALAEMPTKARMIGFSACVASTQRFLVVIGAMLMAASAFLLPSAAAQSDDAADEPDEVVIFVLDLSGSMNEPFDGNRTKLDAAKDAFAEAFANVSPDALVGLRTYGDQIVAAEPAAREPSCTGDSRLASAVGPLRRDQLIDQVRGFAALGDTPIGLALQRASGDVPSGAVATIVLFSDGRDECFDADLDGDAAVGPSYGEDPCDVAKDLASGSAVDRIMTVGFGADSAAETELRCIAQATGGTYTAIQSAADARDILPELLVQFSAPRQAQQLVGRDISGTSDRSRAPELQRLEVVGAEQALYTDEITAGEEKWYRVSEYGPEPGTFTATVFGLPAVADINFDMRAVAPNLNDQVFFTDHGDNNAGLPGRPTSSIRCTDCLISNGPHEVYWVLSLKGKGLSGTYPLEFVTAGPGFGGPTTSCSAPQECWYPSEIAERTAAIEEMEATIASRTGDQAPQGLVNNRDALAAKTMASQQTVERSEARAGELEQRIASAPASTSSFRIPLLMILVGAGLAFVPADKLPGRSKKDDDDETGEPSSGATDAAPADEPTSRRARKTKMNGSTEAPPDVGLPLAAAATGGNRWDAELEAAKAALAGQRPTDAGGDSQSVDAPEPATPTEAVEPEVALSPDAEAARAESLRRAAMLPAEEEPEEERKRPSMTERLAARKAQAAEADGGDAEPIALGSTEATEPVEPATTGPIALGSSTDLTEAVEPNKPIALGATSEAGENVAPSEIKESRALGSETETHDPQNTTQADEQLEPASAAAAEEAAAHKAAAATERAAAERAAVQRAAAEKAAAHERAAAEQAAAQKAAAERAATQQAAAQKAAAERAAAEKAAAQAAAQRAAEQAAAEAATQRATAEQAAAEAIQRAAQEQAATQAESASGVASTTDPGSEQDLRETARRQMLAKQNIHASSSSGSASAPHPPTSTADTSAALRPITSPTPPDQVSASEPSDAEQQPGWYEDPAIVGQLRWWDGTTWTAQTSKPMDQA